MTPRRYGSRSRAVEERVDPLDTLGGILTDAALEMSPLVNMYRGLLYENEYPITPFATPRDRLLTLLEEPEYERYMDNVASSGMGATTKVGRAAKALPAPRTKAEAVAKDVLELRATGKAERVTDEMMAAADPQYLFENTPLPMDEASRMARAREMGFGVDRSLYHGSPADITEFEARRAGKNMQMDIPGVHLAEDTEFASMYAPEQGGSVYDVFARPGRQLDATKLVEEGTEEAEIVNALYKGTGRRPYWTSTNFEGTGPKVTGPLSQAIDLNPRKAVKELRDRGYNSVLYEAEMRTVTPYGFIEGASSPTLLVLDPKDIRSRRARFDPEFRHLANLSAGVGGLGILSLLEPEPEVP